MSRQLIHCIRSCLSWPFSWWLYTMIILWLVTKLNSFFKRLFTSESTARIAPGNRVLPLIGETLQFMASINSSKGFYEFVKVRQQRYGKCFRTYILGEVHVFVSSTESAKEILNNDFGKYTKRYIRSIAQVVGDQSLLCASPQRHKLLRHRFANLFSVTSMSIFVTNFDKFVIDALKNWKSRNNIVVLDEALKITFKAMCKMLMSLEAEDELEILQQDVRLICEAMLAFPLRLPWTKFHKGLQARERFMSTLDKKMSERRKDMGAYDDEDFLQHLLMEEDKVYSDDEIKDNILTMIIAGQDTTASAITWMVKYLDENQEVLNILKAEQIPLGSRSSHFSMLTLEDLNNMPYASKVVKESLRMASIVPWFPRLALQDCEIYGYTIKKGWNINIDAKSIHLDPALYNDPNKFFPSRFEEETKPYSFLAFGQGGRTCLGMNLAKAMMLVFLHRLVTTYTWEVTDCDSCLEKWALFSKLKSGCPIKITPIETSTAHTP